MILWSRCDHDFCCAHGTENTLWHWLFNGMNWWKILVCLQPSLSTCLPCFLDSILQAWPQARLQWHFSRCRVSWLQSCWILLNFVDMEHRLARWLAMAMLYENRCSLFTVQSFHTKTRAAIHSLGVWKAKDFRTGGVRTQWMFVDRRQSLSRCPRIDIQIYVSDIFIFVYIVIQDQNVVDWSLYWRIHIIHEKDVVMFIQRYDMIWLWLWPMTSIDHSTWPGLLEYSLPTVTVPGLVAKWNSAIGLLYSSLSIFIYLDLQ